MQMPHCSALGGNMPSHDTDASDGSTLKVLNLLETLIFIVDSRCVQVSLVSLSPGLLVPQAPPGTCKFERGDHQSGNKGCEGFDVDSFVASIMAATVASSSE